MQNASLFKAIPMTLLTAIVTVASTAAVQAAPALSDRQAIVASGNCIAKYAGIYEDAALPATEVGQKIAGRCAKQIARAAQAATRLSGKPEELAQNLKYAREDLTTGTVERARASKQRLASL
jgi:hypothetical protein